MINSRKNSQSACFEVKLTSPCIPCAFINCTSWCYVIAVSSLPAEWGTRLRLFSWWRGTLGGAEHRNTAENIDKYRNTAKKIGKYRNTASKVDEIPKSQKRGILLTLCFPADKNCVVKDLVLLSKYFFVKFIIFFSNI